MLTRRGFLVYLGMGSYSMLRSFSALGDLPTTGNRASGAVGFTPIQPSSADSLIVPRGFRYDLVASYGDALGSSGPHGPETFGYDSDFIAYFPIDALKGGKNSSHGLLWVNHEFIKPLFVSGGERKAKRTIEQLRKEHQAVGGSVIEVKREKGKWKRVPNSKFARRFTADYPEMKVTGPAAALHPVMRGTLANCSGGHAPWHTALSAEENFQLFNPGDGHGLNWGATPQMAIDETGYGWIVEVDPFGELPPRKHTALGKFSHENAALRLGTSGRLAVYMGDDAADQYFYKYVSNERLKAGMSREQQSALLSSGTLYVAHFEKRVWIPLDIQRTPTLASAGFKNQAEVLMRTRDAAKAVGATPMDRPEDCEVHPFDGTVYIALTNNVAHGNHHGQILRIHEDRNDAESEKFTFEIFLAGGTQSGLSCPDNLMFDRKGNLWVACDISSSSLNRKQYAPFGNNGLYLVPTKGKSAGDAFQFASGPIEAELTGPCFNPAEDTLFLSVQHPGEDTVSLDKLTSHWPSGKGLPQPSVVAIQGF